MGFAATEVVIGPKALFQRHQRPVDVGGLAVLCRGHLRGLVVATFGLRAALVRVIPF